MAAENWNRRVWRLAGPIILANVSVPLLGSGNVLKNRIIPPLLPCI